MTLTATGNKDLLRLRLDGELDHHAASGTVRSIEEALRIYVPRALTLDLSGLAFMDSSGIAVILKAQRRACELGASMTIENVPERPRRVLEAAGIDRIVNLI